jgi:MraZ protein
VNGTADQTKMLTDAAGTETFLSGQISLCGSFSHNLDAKGRINFPAKLREIIGEKFMVARGIGKKFLAVYSMEMWMNVQQQLMAQPGQAGEALMRWVNAGAAEVTPDKQGRILIPGPLREYAQLRKDVLVVGAGRKAEIWNPVLFKEEDDAFNPADYPELLDQLRL